MVSMYTDWQVDYVTMKARAKALEVENIVLLGQIAEAKEVIEELLAQQHCHDLPIQKQ